MMRFCIITSGIAFSVAFPSLELQHPNKMLRTDEGTIFSKVTAGYFHKDAIKMFDDKRLSNDGNEITLPLEKKEKEKENIRQNTLPVCGVKDFNRTIVLNANASVNLMGDERKRRSKRYVKGFGKFNQRRLKYIILKFTKDLSRSQVDMIIIRALNLWANYTNLEFEETLNEEEAHIRISFVTGFHGHWPPFFSGSNIIAHASYPIERSTYVHFNDDWRFSATILNTLQKLMRFTELYRVAVHEFGHNLGLAHCKTTEPAVMCNSFFWDQNSGLHADDIAGIQSIYGMKRKTNKKRKTSLNICSNSFSFDAIYFDDRTEAIYGIKRRFYWKINDFGVMKGYPKKVRSLWKMFPGNINASLHSKSSSKTYFFKGNMVWRYRGGKLDAGFPKPTSFYNIPGNLNAAISIAENGSYVIKGKFAYKFNERPKREQRQRRIRVNKLWPGAPSNIDAAIQWRDGSMYFFKDNRYWRFPGQTNAKRLCPFPRWNNFHGLRKPSVGDYPKNVQRYWIGCTVK